LMATVFSVALLTVACEKEELFNPSGSSGIEVGDSIGGSGNSGDSTNQGGPFGGDTTFGGGYGDSTNCSDPYGGGNPGDSTLAGGNDSIPG